jgi:Divergent InlB B-repeat domain
MGASLTQAATFVDAFPVLTMVAEHGTTDPPTGPQPLDSVVSIEATADPGWVFSRWGGQGNGSHTGTANPASVTMHEPLTETVEYGHGQFELEMLANEGGTVTPGSGGQTSFSDVEITATPDTYHVFGGWKGSGDGSYTGPDRVATITMNGPITEVAEFDRIAYELSLSLSDTDPDVHTGPPVSFGKVYLWLVCGTTGGVTALRAERAGTLGVLGSRRRTRCGGRSRTRSWRRRRSASPWRRAAGSPWTCST